jgi:hypothetical protein
MIMTELLTTLAQLALGFMGLMAPVAVLLVALERRDRRARALNTIALQQLNTPELRGLYAVAVKTRPFGGGRVSVDLWGCSRHQLWDVMDRLALALPRSVRFEVNGLSDRRTRIERCGRPYESTPELCGCGVCR